MSSFDDEIRGAVRAGNDGSSLRSAGDEGMIEQVAATFRGRMRRWILLTWAATLFWVLVAAWAAVSFFGARETREWIMYACVFLFAGMAVAMLKLWYLMEMNRNTHSREIKRLELQVARLVEGRK